MIQALSEDHPSSFHPRASDDEIKFLLATIGFGRRLHEHLDPHVVSVMAVNDGLALTGCDRLSIATFRANRVRIRAITGQEKVSRRSESVRRLEQLALRCSVMKHAIVYAGNISDVDPIVRGEMADYVEESRVRLIALLPLSYRTVRQQREATDARVDGQILAGNDETTFGFLVAELFDAASPPPSMPRRCRLVADQVQSALSAAREHHKIPFRRTIRYVSDSLAALRGRRLLASAAIATLLLALAASMVFVPATFRISCQGVLMPEDRKHYFAPMDAKVTAVAVEDGQLVAKGDILLKMTSEILAAELVSAEVAVSENQKLLESLSASMSILQTGSSNEESVRLQAETARAEIELAGASETLRVLRRRADQLVIRAHSDGVISGFRLREALMNRPVHRGDRLLEVVDPKGPWQLELEIDEYRLGPLADAQQSQGDQLEVQYIMATKVGQKRSGTLRTISTHVDQGADGQKYVIHAIADIALRDESPDYVGAEVFAKINTGKRALGYVLFGDVIDFFRRTIWF